MHQKAFAKQEVDQVDESSASCALAIEPDDRQAKILEETLAGKIDGRLVVVRSMEAACGWLVNAIPDLILMSPLLSPKHEAEILSQLRALGVDASHVQLLSIPRFGKKDGHGDPTAFASEVAEYLSQGVWQRPVISRPTPVLVDAPVDASNDLSLEHVAHLLERLETEEGSLEVIDMPTATSPLDVENARPPVSGRQPRFLTLDDSIPEALRALLVEADGCLKMSFLTGAGACAVRALDMLLADQNLAASDANRLEQVQELGKKHPGIAESFLRVLSLVTTKSDGLWDETRVTLASVILKAIAYEIYVLGPERKERTTYILELLERFNGAK